MTEGMDSNNGAAESTSASAPQYPNHAAEQLASDLKFFAIAATLVIIQCGGWFWHRNMRPTVPQLHAQVKVGMSRAKLLETMVYKPHRVDRDNYQWYFVRYKGAKTPAEHDFSRRRRGMDPSFNLSQQEYYHVVVANNRVTRKYTRYGSTLMDSPGDKIVGYGMGLLSLLFYLFLFIWSLVLASVILRLLSPKKKPGSSVKSDDPTAPQSTN